MISAPGNILFILADQLRVGYLSCEGHPTLSTPNIDALAARGVRFSNAFAQSPVCGPSRMSFYTGRYVTSHGSTWNNVPLSASEYTLGDYLRPLGLDVLLVGKSHVTADRAGMARLGVDPASECGQLISEGGFRVFERDDGIHPDATVASDYAYNRHLEKAGYGGPNPWHHYANSTVGPDGTRLSGWRLRNVGHRSCIPANLSETAYMTDRAIDCLTAQSKPWMLHLSYIKPHWPYVAPAPYNDIYGPDDVLAAIRDQQELVDPHPVYAAYLRREESQSFSRVSVRRTVIPVYMGLVKQIDDEIGRLLRWLDDRELLEKTLIVFTSDHGDYLGDHWLGDKELFHRQSAQIPLIIVDPTKAADMTRGSICDMPVESIDLAPTFVEWCGGEPPEERLEGKSLLPWTRNNANTPWRSFLVSELDSPPTPRA